MSNRLIRSIVTGLALLWCGATWGDAPYVDNGNGTVTNTSNGLMWDQCAAGLIGNGTCSTGEATAYNWQAALALVATQNMINYKGYSDWRLPNVIELQSLVKTDTSWPSIDESVFPNAKISPERAHVYWSSSADSDNSDNAWYVAFGRGDTVRWPKTYGSNHARLVRGGQYQGAFGLYSSGISGVTATSATVSITSSIDAAYYWLVVPRGATPPSAGQVITGDSYGTVTRIANGSGTMQKSTPTTFAICCFFVGNDYDLFVVAKESSFQTISNIVGPIQFRTTAVSTSSIVIDPSASATLYAALDGSGVYASTNGGTSWASINTAGLTNRNVRALAIQNSETLFAATYDGGVFKGTSNGKTWTWASCGIGLISASARLRTLTLDASGNLYAGSENGIFKGTSSCGIWQAMNTGLPL